MAIYPYAGGRYDKYWKYENPDPSTNDYAVKVAREIFEEAQEIITKRGKQIYGVRPEAIIVQDLRHQVIRELGKIFSIHFNLIKKYEQENSGDIINDLADYPHSGSETEQQGQPEDIPHAEDLPEQEQEPEREGEGQDLA